MDAAHEKYRELKDCLERLGSVAVAFSGGADSSFLLQTAADTLGDRAVAVTASSCSFPKRELEEARRFCAGRGIRHILVRSEELDIAGFRQNPENRCYLCKRELFGRILRIAEENGLAAVAEGSNMDDTGDYRPGMIAAAELGVVSPLRDARLTKDEIRLLSRERGLPTWNKPSFACLSSRFVYGETIDEERLDMVDRAEQFLLDMGLRQVRVRFHGQGRNTVARIEVLPEDLPALIREENRLRVYARLREIGFAYVSLDLAGYRTGSMNETLPEKTAGSV